MEPADTPNLAPSPETPQGEVEISQDAAIAIGEALIVAASIPFPIGKSTLQRWAKHWAERGAASPVKCVLVTSRLGSSYRIDRDDFEAWAFEQAQNERPAETPQDLPRPHETQGDPARSHETSRDAKRPHETSQGEADASEADMIARVKALEDDNMQLRIDVGIRKELIIRANDEMRGLRKAADMLLRENGALNYQLAQLEAPQVPKAIGARTSADEPRHEPAFNETHATARPSTVYDAEQRQDWTQ